MTLDLVVDLRFSKVNFIMQERRIKTKYETRSRHLRFSKVSLIKKANQGGNKK